MEKPTKMDISPPHAPPPQRPPPSAPLYTLPPSLFHPEDILLCVDVDAEAHAPSPSTAKTRPLSRLHAVEYALRHFVHAKLSINPDHRFALSTLAASFSWVRKEFTSDASGLVKAFRTLHAPAAPCGSADLTGLFRAANQEAVRSRREGRLLRVVLIYCRSNSSPQHQWPVSEKLFTMDVVYLHDKPGPENCVREVFDALVDALELVTEYEGYIVESSQPITRVVSRLLYTLLCHPQQRCGQDDLDIPKAIVKKLPPPVESLSNEENQSGTSHS